MNGRRPPFSLVGLAGLLLVGTVGAGCTRRALEPLQRGPTCDYVISPPAEGSWLLGVEATLERAPSANLILPGGQNATRDVRLRGEDGRSVAREGDGWQIPECRTRCIVDYVVDLRAMASGCHRMDCGKVVGEAFLGLASDWMMRPQPLGDAVLRVRPTGRAVDRFATGLRRDPAGGFVLGANELGEAAFTAFGSLRKNAVDVPGATLHVTLLGEPLRMGDAATLGWIRNAASAVAGLFGHFPVEATVFVVPVDGADDVVFGRVMSLAGASVELFFGTDARPESAHDDWVAVHELFHLGCPSFVGEGHWLEEGLATYYEPLLRERASWMTEAALWAHFVGNMPRGLRGAEDPPNIEDRDDIDSTYWGGALYAFVADVRIREATQGRRSLDDAIRSVLRVEGDATQRARVADFLRTGDEATGSHVLTELDQSWATLGQNVDLTALWQSLGVVPKGKDVVLDDGAPLAWVRRSIATGEKH